MGATSKVEKKGTVTLNEFELSKVRRMLVRAKNKVNKALLKDELNVELEADWSMLSPEQQAALLKIARDIEQQADN